MAIVRKAGNTKIIKQFLQEHAEHTLTWVEVHGLLCALAVGPVAPDNWQELCYEGEEPLPAEVKTALTKQYQLIASQIAAEQGVKIPCLLDAYADDEGNDLASWCLGFVSGVILGEEQWYPEGLEEEAGELLLPFMLIAGIDEDPELDELWQNEKLVREMATNIPAVLEELFLLYRSPNDNK